MIFDLFEMKDGELTINMKLANMTSAYAKLCMQKRCKGFPSDADGRKRYRAQNELRYIYHRYTPTAHCIKNGLTDREAEKYCLNATDMPKLWEKDDVFNNAIKEYKKELFGVKIKTFTNLTRSLNTINNVVDLLITKTEEDLDDPNLPEDVIVKLIGRQKELLNLISEVPKKIISLDESEKQAKEELTHKEKMWGGEPIPDSAIPGQGLG